MTETKYKQTEVGLIPEDWEVIKIGEISSSRMYGVGASAIGYDGKTKYIRITDIDDNYGRFVPNPLTSPQYYLDRHIVREDDLLVARTGASVGKTYLYDKADGRLVFAGFLMKVHIDRGSSKYIFYQTKTNFYKLWVESESARTGQPGINIKQFENFSVPLPPLSEQHAIASTLTSVDNLIVSLDKQITKTQSVKEGAMQQLLTGRTRLKGFSEPWKEKKIGEVAEVGTGTSNRQDATEYGVYPFYVRSKDIYKSDIYEYDEEAIVIPGEGGIGEIFHYVKGKYALHQRAYRIHFIFDYINTKFAYYYLKNNFSRYIYEKAVFATVSSIRKPMIDEFPIRFPSINEQHAIASTLTAIDDQISALEAKRKKYEMVKVGMMQQLLTGRIRLK